MHRTRFALILLLLIFTVLVGSLAISCALISHFNNLSSLIIKTIWILPLVLTIGFIVAQIIGSKYYNSLMGVIYSTLAVWMGLYVYLLMASVLTIITDFFGIYILGHIFMLAAVAATIYGVFHSENIQIKRISVAIKNIPEVWKKRTVVFVSDLHLGLVHGKGFALKVTQKINELNPHIIFIGGDLYDGSVKAIPFVTPPLSALKPKLGIFLILGNHEQFGDSAPFIAGAQGVGMKILQEELVEIDGLQIAGISHSESEERDTLSSVFKNININRSKPSILLSHEPRHIDIAESVGISLQLSGHTHRAQQWPLNYIPKKIFKGFDYGLKSSGTTQVYTSSGVGTWGPPVRVGTDSEIVIISFT